MSRRDEKPIEIVNRRRKYPNSRRPPLDVLKELCECYTTAEIARMTGVKPNTVRVWISRANKRYREAQEREALEQQGEL